MRITPRSFPRVLRRCRSFESLESRDLLTVVINEIHFAPDLKTEQVEFIELFNAGTDSVDLSGWRIDDAVDFEFPTGSLLPSNRFAVVTQNAADFAWKYGFEANGVWQDGDRLANEGERIELVDAAGRLIDEVRYAMGFPWPTVGDKGESMELIHPRFDNRVPGNWSSSITSKPNTLVAKDATWTYRKGIANNPPDDWTEVEFDPATDNVLWEQGPATIGYGDNDDETILSDMRNSYSSIYLRNEFLVVGDPPEELLLRLYVDDGAIVYINGDEVARAHVGAGNKHFNSTGTNHEAAWEEFRLTGLSDILVPGNNTIAIHALNQSTSSSDFSFNAELLIGVAGLATPGKSNSSFAMNAGPNLEALTQSAVQPTSGEDMVISVRATDVDGVANVTLEYQLVDPGKYIRLSDPDYETNWTTLVMQDDGRTNDATAGDSVYTATLPSDLQTHRRLVRYRIHATDKLGAASRGPRLDDPQPNFAYFVYDGIPDWNGANRPNSTPVQTFDSELLDQGMAAYHLIADNTDVTRSQYESSFRSVRFDATLVYDGVVYDHIEFSNRGEASTYVSGKNKWRVDFRRGHDFAARDNYGKLYNEKWRRLTLNANAAPWSPPLRGSAGLDESVSHRLYQLAGVAAPNTNYVHFRIIDDADEATSNQYEGDFWGLYLAVEHTGGRYLDEHGLEDGNVYEIEGGGGDARNLAAGQPTDGSDWTELRTAAQRNSTTEQYWREHVNLDTYYSFRAINRATGNIDLRDGANYVMYHGPDGWQPVPWDLDMMYAPETHWSGQTYLASMLQHDALEIEFKNRSRELLDLLFSDASQTGGQVAQLVDEYARFLNPVAEDGSYGQGWAEADQYMWNYHPRTSSSHRGNFYKTPINENRRGGTWTRRLDSPDFDGMVKYITDYMTDTDPDSFAVGDGDQRGYGFNYLALEAKDDKIPERPTLSYSGTAGYPLDEVRLSASAFSDPDGSEFAAMEWRVAEISNPATLIFDPDAEWLYEIDSIWESGEIPEFAREFDIPASTLQAGRTYRARVRMQDDTGRWSHWSEPVEFVAAGPVSVPTLAITELHYHPAMHPDIEDNEDQEFIEILNTGTAAVDLAGVQITEFANTPYTFPAGLTLAPGDHIIVARSPTAFATVYGTELNVAPTGYANANLGNASDTVTLVSASGVQIMSITYTDDEPWQTAADGEGPSLEIIDPTGVGSDPSNWRASANSGGSPGYSGVERLAGDANADGQVSFADFLLLSANFGKAEVTWEQGDFDGDGGVSFADFLILSKNFGRTANS